MLSAGYTEVAVSSLEAAYTLRVPTDGWSGCVGLDGLVKYQNDTGCG